MNQISSSDHTDHNRRQIVLTQKPTTIIVRVASKVDLGLRKVNRDSAAIEAKHQELANRLNVNPMAYADPGKRVVPDTGLKIVSRQSGVSLRDFIPVLRQRGYGFTDGHCFARDGGKDPVNVLVFTLDGTDNPLPPRVPYVLNNAILSGLYVWANRTAEGGRLDTVNATDTGQRGRGAPKTLVLAGNKGNSYDIAASR